MKIKWIFKVKGSEIPLIGIIIFLIVFIWSLGLIIAPLTLPSGSVTDLSGKTMIKDNGDVTEDMNPYAKHYYESGDVNCHTKVERSFFINGNQMPFCARDVGIFFGMALGLFIALFKRFDIKLWWVIGGLVPMGVDWLSQSYFSFYHNNLTRLITGGIAGVVITLALGFVVFDVSKSMELRTMLKSQSTSSSVYDLPPESQGNDPGNVTEIGASPHDYQKPEETPSNEEG